MFLQPASAAAAKPLPVSPDCFLSLQLVPSRRPRPKPNATVPALRLKDKIDDFGGFRQSFGSWNVGACMLANDKNKVNLNIELLDVTKRSAWSFSVPRKVSRQVQQEAEKRCEKELPGAQKETPTGRTEKKQFVDLMQVTPSFSTGILDDPFVNKLRSRLGSWHGTTISFPPVTRTVVALFGFFFFLVGVVFDKLWTSRKVKKQSTEPRTGIRPQVPTSLSRFLEEDLQRKESVEWVNMVLGKLWKVYRLGLEDWLVGLLQPLIDNLNKPDYVQRVEIKQFCLGEEPISVRSVERRTSRRANDLQYQIGLRYTGGARMLLMLSLKFGIVPIMIPVGVRDLDVDGELWVKLRLVPSEPWVGTVTWAFVSLPKIKLDLAPFRIFNLMAIPVLSMFLTKLLTEDLPRLFVRPNEIVLNFQKGRATGPVSKDFKNGIVQEGNRDFVGELSVTLVDARKLNYVPYGKTDPYVVLVLGDQVIRSKKNSQTTVIGPPGAPIWNQDFQLLVVNPQKQRLSVEVRDSFGLTTFTIGVGEVELGTLQDTVPTDRIVTLQGGWGLFKKRFSGEILLRLTYKAYVEDEEDDKTRDKPLDDVVSDEEMSESEEKAQSDTSISKGVSTASEKESFMDKFVALLVSEEFQGIFASEAGSIKNAEEVTASQSFAANPKDGNKTIQFMDNENSTAQFVDSANSTTQIMDNEKEKDQEGFVIFWLGLVTGIAVLVAISLNGSNFFNP